MLEYGPDVRYLGPGKELEEESAKERRVLAEYSMGDWIVESQIELDGEWYLERRNTLPRVPDDESE